jgi:polyphosphate kinase
MIETELRERRVAPIVRLEVRKGMSKLHRGMLAAELGLEEDTDVAEVEGMMGTRDLMEIAGLDRSDLHDPPHHPSDHARLTGDRNIFHALRDAGSILIQHPWSDSCVRRARIRRSARSR